MLAPVLRSPSSARPALAQQLASLNTAVDSLNSTLRSLVSRGSSHSHAADAAHSEIFSIPCVGMTVGTLTSRQGSPVLVHRDRLEYTFAHPSAAAEILMVMHYHHLKELKQTGKRLSWKVNRKLESFPRDYDPAHGAHKGVLSMEFVSAQQAERVAGVMKLGQTPADDNLATAYAGGSTGHRRRS